VGAVSPARRATAAGERSRCAENIASGGSLRDVQELVGRASPATTQRYIQGDADAKRKMVDLWDASIEPTYSWLSIETISR
jgi:hypothetical protein